LIILYNLMSIPLQQDPTTPTKCPKPEPKVVIDPHPFRALNKDVLAKQARVTHGNIRFLASPTFPSYILATHEGAFPYADGDRAQGMLLKGINLEEKCRTDNATIVVDIGAYLGDFGLYAAACGCQVYIFEPQPLLHSIIQLSIIMNGFEDRIHLYNYAVSPQPSKVLHFELKGGSTHQTELEGPNVVSVSSISLDEILPTEHIFLLKIDVEGFDPSVLFGAANRTLDQKRFTYIISEYSVFWNTEGRGPWEDFLPRLHALGGLQLFSLHRTDQIFYTVLPSMFNEFYKNHVDRHLQTDIFIIKGDALVPGTPQMWSSTAYG